MGGCCFWCVYFSLFILFFSFFLSFFLLQAHNCQQPSRLGLCVFFWGAIDLDTDTLFFCVLVSRIFVSLLDSNTNFADLILFFFSENKKVCKLLSVTSQFPLTFVSSKDQNRNSKKKIQFVFFHLSSFLQLVILFLISKLRIDSVTEKGKSMVKCWISLF